MEEVCKPGHKKLRKDSRGGRTFLGEEIYIRQAQK